MYITDLNNKTEDNIDSIRYEVRSWKANVKAKG